MRAWDTGDRVMVPLSRATGTVVTVRRRYIIVSWDDLARKRVPGLPERTKLGHKNALVRI